MAEGVALDLLARGLLLGDDLVDPGALGEEDVDVADLVHDAAQPLGLPVDVDGQLGQVDGVDVPPFLGQAEGGRPLLLDDPRVVVLGGLGGQVTAVAAHDLVDDEHPGVGPVLADDVLGESRGLLGRGPGAQGLTDGNDVVVDRLGEPHDRQVVVVLLEVGREVGGCRVGVVAADRVEHVHAVGAQALGCDLEGILAFLDQAALHEVLRVRQLDAGVADRRSAEAGEDVGAAARLLADDDVVAGQEAVVSVLVGDDLDVGGDLGVALDEPSHGGGQAGGETAGSEQSDATNRHDGTFLKIFFSARGDDAVGHICTAAFHSTRDYAGTYDSRRGS